VLAFLEFIIAKDVMSEKSKLKKIEIIHKYLIKGMSKHKLWITFLKNRRHMQKLSTRVFFYEIAKYR